MAELVSEDGEEILMKEFYNFMKNYFLSIQFTLFRNRHDTESHFLKK